MAFLLEKNNRAIRSRQASHARVLDTMGTHKSLWKSCFFFFIFLIYLVILQHIKCLLAKFFPAWAKKIISI